ncbi:MAG: hypothetical protein HZA79_15205 [Sphingobacteriales bacterium]|nr:hypothetical protein [Sphingobacteriales bacterium]
MNRKKYISLLFFILGCIPLLSMVFADISKWNIKIRNGREGPYTRQLQTIRLPASAVVWMDKNEIFVNGKMFDISSRQLENGWYTFKGKYDSRETELLDRQLKKTPASGNELYKLTRIFNCLHSLYYTHAVEQPVLAGPGSRYPFPVAIAPVLHCPEILTPPPQQGGPIFL